VMTVSANTADALNELARQFVGKIGECAEASGAPMETLGTPQELKLRTIMPRVAVGGIIGKGGAAIKQLRETSGAKVNVASETSQGPGQEQIVTITGTQQALEYVMQEANTQVQNLGEEVWFQEWASFSAARGGDGYGPSSYGNDKGGRGKDKGGYDNSKGGGGGYKSASKDRGYGGGDGYSGGGGGHDASGVGMMMRVAKQLPPHVMEDSRGFAMSCTVPNRLVGGLIGRSGANTKEVQHQTGTKIGIREIPGDPENRTLNIAGPLAATCSAYMLMMQRYLEVESDAPDWGHEEDSKGQKGGKGGKGGEEDRKGGKSGKGSKGGKR